MKRLYLATAEALVWADDEDDAWGLLAGDDSIDWEIRILSPEVALRRYPNDEPYGASLPVRLLVGGGDAAQHDDPRACWPATLDGQEWLTDGYAAFREPLPEWILDPQRKKIDMRASKLDEQIATYEAGAAPIVEIAAASIEDAGRQVHRIADGVAIDARYLAAAPPGAAWHWAGGKTALFAVAEGRLVAIVMPIYDVAKAVRATR